MTFLSREVTQPSREVTFRSWEVAFPLREVTFLFREMALPSRAVTFPSRECIFLFREVTFAAREVTLPLANARGPEQPFDRGAQLRVELDLVALPHGDALHAVGKLHLQGHRHVTRVLDEELAELEHLGLVVRR